MTGAALVVRQGRVRRRLVRPSLLLMALLLIPMLCARCACSGARLYPPATARVLATCHDPSEVLSAPAPANPEQVAWLGVFDGVAELRGRKFLRYRFLRAADLETVLLEARWLEVLVLSAAVTRETDQEFYVDSSRVNDEGPRSDMGRATRASALWVGRARSDGDVVVLDPEMPVIETRVE